MIRTLEKEELKKLAGYAYEFYEESKTLGAIGFVKEKFVAAWGALYDHGTGIIIVMEDEDTREFYGALGAIIVHDLYSDTMTATEAFWYVMKRRRGEGTTLLNAFEAFSRQQGCKYTRMIYLQDSMPDAVRGMYERRGYVIAEVSYQKEIVS